MFTTTLQRILNALAFANIDNRGDFNRLLEQMDIPQKTNAPSSAMKLQSARSDALGLNPHFVLR